MMWAWLNRNAGAIEAVGAVVTGVAAIAALILIPLQIASADRIQRDQTAREIYREFLNLTVQKPELAEADYCAITEDTQRIAYESYVEYLLYTAEQMIESDPDWRDPMASYIGQHMAYLCSNQDWDKQSDGVYAIVLELRTACQDVPSCPTG
jgi:hypothetical protein